MTINIDIDPEVVVSITDLPDPFTFNLLLSITNNENQDLYFRATLVNPPAGYSNYTKNLGLISAGGSALKLYSLTRSKPALTDGEYTEALTVRVEAYTDSAYSNLYATKDIQVTVTYIDHKDPAFTVIDVDNFDDGTVEGWAQRDIGENFTHKRAGPGAPEVGSGHYVSQPYALTTDVAYFESNNAVVKSFNVPSGYTKAYLVMHFWSNGDWGIRIVNSQGKKLVKPSTLLNDQKWYRVAVKLPTGESTTVQLQGETRWYVDEIYVIAK